MQKNIRKLVGTTLAAGLIWTACDQAPVAPENNPPNSGAIAFGFGPDGTPGLEEFEVCKVGTSANFDWSIGGSAQTGFSLNDGECRVIHQVGGAGATVMVRERIEDFTNEQLDQVMVEVLDATGTTGPFAGSNPWTDDIGGGGVTNGPRGVTVTFYNSYIPVEGGEGCTPGYWRQPQHFDSWTNHLPGDSFDSVFDPDGVALERPETGTTASLTLLQAVRLRGGGVNALIRHTVAALLNAESAGVSYDLTPGDVLAKYTAAIGGDVEGQHTEFATFNEQGCPLN